MPKALFHLMAMVGLLASVASAQDLRELKPPLLRGIPLGIQRPLEPVDVVRSGMETVVTINTPDFQQVRTDIRTTNAWITADNVRYDLDAVFINEETTITIGNPGEPAYIVTSNLVSTLRETETIVFPNRTYIVASLSSTTSNGVLGQMQFRALKYLYGTRLSQPLNVNQYERLKDWLGIE